MTEEEKAHIVAAAKSIAKRMKGKFVLNEATDTPEPPIYSGYIEEAEPPANLLSCPFCGAHPHHGLTKVEYDQLHGDPFQRGRVWCPKGHASVTSTNLAMAKAEWNKRFENPTPAEPPATVGDMIAAVDAAIRSGVDIPLELCGRMPATVAETDLAAQAAELREALGHMTPIVVHETPDYAEVMFGEGITHRSQCMTMNPADWLALNTALPIIDAQAAEIAALKAEIAELSEAYLELAMDGQTPETVKANRQKVGAWVARITAALAQVQP